MNPLEATLYFILAIVIVNFCIGLIDAKFPEVMPPHVRKLLGMVKPLKFNVVVYYESVHGKATHASVIEARDIEQAEYYVTKEANEKKFISLGGGKVIPTKGIVEISVEPKKATIEEIMNGGE